MVEPAGFSTDWRGPSAVVAEPMPGYEEVRDYRAARGAEAASWRPGDPEATGPAILELVDAEEPPLRTFFGTGTLDMIREEYAQADRELGELGPPGRRGPGRSQGARTTAAWDQPFGFGRSGGGAVSAFGFESATIASTAATEFFLRLIAA